MITLLLAALTTFRFGGGSGLQLVDQVEGVLHRPVIFVAGIMEEFPRFSFRYEDEKDFRKGLRVNSGLQTVPNTFALTTKGWVEEYISFGSFLGQIPESKQQNGQWPAKAEKDGTITLPANNGYLSIAAIPQTLLGKPVTVHPLFQYMRVAARGAGIIPKELIDSIAAAVGARVEETNDAWNLKLDVKEYRRRMHATLAARAVRAENEHQDPINVADINLCAEAIDAASDEQLEKVIDGKHELELAANPGTALARATMTRIDAYLHRRDIANGGSKPADVVAFASRLDMDRPIFVIVDPLRGLAHVRGMVRGMPTAGIDF